MQNDHYIRVYAGFFVRLAAYTTDMILMFFVLFALRISRLVLLIKDPDAFPVKNVIFSYSPIDLLMIFITVLYFVLCTYFGGATLGKRLFRIKVVSAYKRKPTLWEIVYRETAGRFLSSIFDIGYIVLAADGRKRGFHDMLADTRVIYVHCADAYDHYRDINESPGEGYSTWQTGENGRYDAAPDWFSGSGVRGFPEDREYGNSDVRGNLRYSDGVYGPEKKEHESDEKPDENSTWHDAGEKPAPESSRADSAEARVFNSSYFQSDEDDKPEDVSDTDEKDRDE